MWTESLLRVALALATFTAHHPDPKPYLEHGHGGLQI
jgi:hypothetical protein